MTVGQIVLTKYGRGIIRALSQTTDCVVSVDVELVDLGGRTIGWVTLHPGEVSDAT